MGSDSSSYSNYYMTEIHILKKTIVLKVYLNASEFNIYVQKSVTIYTTDLYLMAWLKKD